MLVAVLSALPFLLGAYYLQERARLIDTMPLDDYAGLRWTPDRNGLAFLHRPLQKNPPAETELYSYGGSGSQFQLLKNLPADYNWTLTNVHSDQWFVLKAKKGEETRLAFCNSTDLKFVELQEGWQVLRSRGDGLYIQTQENNLPFDQFADVEAAPDVKPALEQLPSYEQQPEEAETPTHLGLQISRYQVESQRLEPLLVIPYNRPEEKPIVQMVRPSPDGRFLALVVKFGESGSPGLWIYDSENGKLLWTRLLVAGECQGLDWSSDSVKVAVSDEKGVAILEAALGIESTRLELSSSEGLRPRWGAGYRLFLVNDSAVYKVESEKNKVEPFFNASSHQGTFSDLVLDPLGSRAAFSISPRGYRELVIWDLRSNKVQTQVDYPGSEKQKAQGTITYQLGSAIRYAWLLWSGQL